MEEQLVVLVDPWQDKYDRLLEANEKLQKLNQTLEDKLLKLAEKNHAETSGLSEQIQDLTQRLVDARLYIHQLTDENDRYRNDINVVIQLLQCKPSNFISPKIETLKLEEYNCSEKVLFDDSIKGNENVEIGGEQAVVLCVDLPDDLQRKILGIKNGLGSGGTRKEKKIIKVQVPTFPPTDIMYAVDKGKGKKNGEKDIVSAAIMAKVLQERENERKENRKNSCQCRYRVTLPTEERSSQTMPSCTISYSEFEFCSEPEEVEDEDDDTESIVTHTDLDTNLRTSHPASRSASVASHRHSVTPSYHQQNSYPPRRPNSWVYSGSGRLPGGAVPVRTTLTTTFDEIIKTSVEEEARLPTPLFGGHLRHRNQSSTSQSSYRHHIQHYDNHHPSEMQEQYTQHHQPHHPLQSYHHTQTDNPPQPEANSYRETPPPPCLQRSSSSSLSSPTSGIPPLSIPTSASITTDLNGDIMMMSSSISSTSSTGNPGTSNNSSHVMSSACNTPSSCSNVSTSGAGGSSGYATGGMFHEPLPMPNGRKLSSTNSDSSSGTFPSCSQSHHNGGVNNVVTIRKGRLSTSHISNVCENGSVTSGGGAHLTRSTSTSWNREKLEGQTGTHGSSSSIGSSASSAGASGGGLGLMTSLGNHWRSTVLVHSAPPRSHSSYEPLSLVSVQGDGSGGQQTTFSSAASPKSVVPSGGVPEAEMNTSQDNEYSLECNSDSEQPLLHPHHHQQQPQAHHHPYGSGGGSNPPTYLFHAYHNPNPQQGSGTASGNYFFGNSVISSNNGGYAATSTSSANTISNPNQYYRAQKRTFWARSSSTTSTETEI